MKTNCWLILGTMLATTAVAQVNTNKLPEIPPPATATPGAPPPTPMVMTTETPTNAPAKKAVKAKKKATKTVKKTKAATKTVEKKAPAAPVNLVAGLATVSGEHVNLRGQAGLKGEVMGHLQKGDAVTVISEINLDKHKAGEPAQWAKILLPASIKVWVDAKYVDASNNVVTAKKLNLRGGPGENYSVLGTLEKGTSIAPVIAKGDWIQIEPPTNAFAFVAASLLKQEGSMIDANATPLPIAANTEAVPPPAVPPTQTTVAEGQTIAPPATTPPPTTDTTPATPPVTTEATPPPPPATTAPLPQPTLAPDDTNLPPPPPRIVTHEGSVRHSVSPVAPTDYELFDPADGKAINYLFSTTTNLNLSRYSGLHITVTGEEGLDVRWKDTPVLTIQKIYVLSGDKPLQPVKKHWWSK